MPDKPEKSAFKLLSSRKTLVMATADKNGAPNVSYAPFVHRAPPLYVYTSSLSRHTRNMMETAKASVMFIEDEARTRNFLHERASPASAALSQWEEKPQNGVRRCRFSKESSGKCST
jgi:putative heme iron utilization protein